MPSTKAGTEICQFRWCTIQMERRFIVLKRFAFGCISRYLHDGSSLTRSSNPYICYSIDRDITRNPYYIELIIKFRLSLLAVNASPLFLYSDLYPFSTCDSGAVDLPASKIRIGRWIISNHINK